ncbi:MAG: hypothetical protein JO256_10730 [Alphaproteobacteria bacterium]|nr:hypothetical protein [Alphaproteobacteria bacterium]
MLAAESQQVIALRVMKLAGGGRPAEAEFQRMTAEKLTAAAQAGLKLMTGGSADSILRDYRRKVRANRRRLAR